MSEFSNPKEVRTHIRQNMGLSDRGRVDKAKKNEFERRCKEICAEYGWDDWKGTGVANKKSVHPLKRSSAKPIEESEDEIQVPPPKKYQTESTITNLMTMPAEAFINMTGIAYMAQTQNAIQTAANAGLSGEQIVAMLGSNGATKAMLQEHKTTKPKKSQVVVAEVPALMQDKKGDAKPTNLTVETEKLVPNQETMTSNAKNGGTKSPMEHETPNSRASKLRGRGLNGKTQSNSGRKLKM